MFDRSNYFIREHVGLLKMTDTYDILNPETQAVIGVAKEEPSGAIIALRFLVNKQLMPTTVNIYEGSDPQSGAHVLSIKRGLTLFRSRIDVTDASGATIGWFKSKAFSLGPSFRVFDKSDREVALVKGDWKGWNFTFTGAEGEIGTITKKWNGIGKELFTSADNYMIDLTCELNPQKAMLLVAAGIAIDTIYKE